MHEPITDVLASYTETIARLLKDVIALQAKVAELNADTNRLLGQTSEAKDIAESRRKKLASFFDAARTARDEMLSAKDGAIARPTKTARAEQGTRFLGCGNQLAVAMNALDKEETRYDQGA